MFISDYGLQMGKHYFLLFKNPADPCLEFGYPAGWIDPLGKLIAF
jgi:hypothetical protein